jgi:hypothetical protein
MGIEQISGNDAFALSCEEVAIPENLWYWNTLIVSVNND